MNQEHPEFDLTEATGTANEIDRANGNATEKPVFCASKAKARDVLLATKLSVGVSLEDAVREVMEETNTMSRDETEWFANVWQPKYRSLSVSAVLGNDGEREGGLYPADYRHAYLNDPDSAFTNNLVFQVETDAGVKSVDIGAAKIDLAITSKRTVTGRDGALGALAGLKVVTPGSIYLPDSMLYLSHTPMDLDERCIIDDELVDSKDTIGKWTGGIGYTVPETYVNRALWPFLLSFTKGTSLKGAVTKTSIDTDALLRCIKVTDMANLYASHLATLKPNGDDINLLCQTTGEDGTTCMTSTTMRVNFRNALYQNVARLTNTQLEFLANSNVTPRGQHTLEEIQEMQDSIVNPFSTAVISVDLDGNGECSEFELNLWNPDCAYCLSVGEEWLNGMIEMIAQRQGNRYVGVSRRSQLSRKLMHNKCRLHLPWIKSVRVIAADVTLEGVEAIDTFLQKVSANTSALEQLEDAIDKFQEYCGITVAAVPAVECDNCGEIDQAVLDARGSKLIPFNMTAAFFAQHLPSTSTVITERIQADEALVKLITKQ